MKIRNIEQNIDNACQLVKILDSLSLYSDMKFLRLLKSHRNAISGVIFDGFREKTTEITESGPEAAGGTKALPGPES